MTDYTITGEIAVGGGASSWMWAPVEGSPVLTGGTDLGLALGTVAPTLVLSFTVDLGLVFGGDIAPTVGVSDAGMFWDAVLGGAITPGVTLTAGGGAAAAISGTAGVSASLLGSLVVERTPAEGAEAQFDAIGVRPSLPVIVYVLAANGMSDVNAGQVPAGQSFLVSAGYVGEGGDPFFEAGAAPNYVGTWTVPTYGPPYPSFRAPTFDEVVWFQPSSTLYRYFTDPRTNTVMGWQLYRSMPERALTGQIVFNVFDPDGIYLYYARLVGAQMAQLQYDNWTLLSLYDPAAVSHWFLPLLAANWGLELAATDSEQVQRSKTSGAVSLFKLKGLPESVQLRLRALGYTGYANEVWVNPTNASNFQSAVTNPDGSASSGPTGAGTDYREYPHGYRTNDPVSDAPITAESQGLTIASATQTGRVQLPAIQAGTLDLTITLPSSGGTFVLDDNGSGAFTAGANTTSLVLSTSSINYTTGAWSVSFTGAAPAGGTILANYSKVIGGDGYYPSSRVAIHLNDGSGNPLALSAADMAVVSTSLMADILPAHVDVRYFATDIPVTASPEGVVVADTLTITQT